MSVSMATAHFTPPPGPTTYFWAAILAPHWASFLCTIFSSSAGALPFGFTMPEIDPPLATGPPAYWAGAAAAKARARAGITDANLMEILRYGWGWSEENMQPSVDLVLVRRQVLRDPI